MLNFSRQCSIIYALRYSDIDVVDVVDVLDVDVVDVVGVVVVIFRLPEF